jgi:hypothetical protein
MWVRALKTFKGRHGKIRAGEKFNAEPGYVAQLVRNKLVQPTEPPNQDAPGPKKNRRIPAAPHEKEQDAPQGNAEAGVKPASDSAEPGAAGKAITSASLGRDQASKPTTSKPLNVGGRVGKPTPRQKKKADRSRDQHAAS